MPDFSMNKIAKAAGHLLYDPSEGWQPGRLRRCHQEVKNSKFGDYIPEEYQIKMEQRVVYVRPVLNPSAFAVAQYREEGCDGQKWYQIHPDSMRDLIGWEADVEPVYACEHEVLTD